MKFKLYINGQFPSLTFILANLVSTRQRLARQGYRNRGKDRHRESSNNHCAMYHIRWSHFNQILYPAVDIAACRRRLCRRARAGRPPAAPARAEAHAAFPAVVFLLTAATLNGVKARNSPVTVCLFTTDTSTHTHRGHELIFHNAINAGAAAAGPAAAADSHVIGQSRPSPSSPCAGADGRLTGGSYVTTSVWGGDAGRIRPCGDLENSELCT
ncbi:hypothetical protein EVAR_94204_1 [Eumeta japonica]|uniref:Uncharacterized protein n=1 Tax=Eumeta variegata TaxID=151549 RepID=A0A4C1UNN7_EUMVA|nr:hypothetical protein EVAR_94204_1 [Eumeta japonica]